MGDVCENCGEEFTRIAKHWNAGPCNPPSLTAEQKEILTGLLMGDGSVQKHKPCWSPRFCSNMTTKKYLKYVDSKFPLYGQGVSVEKTPEESHAALQESFDRPTTVEDCKTVYRWYTKTVTVFEPFHEWYQTGKKVFPENIELTPTVLKHWYCGDGSIKQRESSYTPYLTIACTNEIGNFEKLQGYFIDCGLPEPLEEETRIRWNVDAASEIFDYMGEPLPGFEYKWPEEYR